MARILEGQNFIPSFKDPSVALEATQGNQVYSFEQSHQTYGNVEDELNLSPDWQPFTHYEHVNGLTYYSTDQMEWTLLQPTRMEDLFRTPDEELNSTTSLSNDFRPVTRNYYSQDLSYQDLSTTQTQVGKLGYSSWQWTTGRTGSGLADV